MSTSTRTQADANADIVRRGYHAFNSAYIQTLNELITPQASWHTPGRSTLAGDHRGRDAVLAQFGRYGGPTQGTSTRQSVSSQSENSISNSALAPGVRFFGSGRSTLSSGTSSLA